MCFELQVIAGGCRELFLGDSRTRCARASGLTLCRDRGFSILSVPSQVTIAVGEHSQKLPGFVEGREYRTEAILPKVFD